MLASILKLRILINLRANVLHFAQTKEDILMVLKLITSILVSLTLIGCVGEESSSKPNNATQGYEVTLSGDWINGATVVDSNNQKATYKGKGVYVFNKKPQGQITLSGGRFAKTNARNQMVMRVDANTRTLSPVNSFLYENPHLKDKVLNALSHSSTGNQTLDKQTLSKTSKVIYLMASNNLLSPFSRSLNSVQSYNDIVRSARAASQQSNNSALINASLALMTLSFFDITNKADIAKITNGNTGNIIKRYVTESGAGSKNGRDWQNAFDKTQIQQAINEVASEKGAVWIAKGIYKPSEMDNTISFELKNGVKLYGGFNGNETNLNTRDITNNKTIFSGDIDNNDKYKADGITPSYRYIQGKNTLTIIKLADATDANTRIDGIYITAGKSTDANIAAGLNIISSKIILENVHFDGNLNFGSGVPRGSGKTTKGAAIRAISQSNLSIKNSTFTDNGATYGSGIQVENSSMTIDGTTFSKNYARFGEAISNNKSLAIVKNSTFKDNISSKGGGALHYESVKNGTKIDNAAFINNYSVLNGGAIYNTKSAYPMTQITFNGNSSGKSGGAIYNSQSSNTINASTFAYNTSYNQAGASTNAKGGAIYNNSSAPKLVNTTFYNNHSSQGGAMFTSSSPTNPMIVNSVFWSNNSRRNSLQYEQTSHNNARSVEEKSHIQGQNNQTDPRLIEKSKTVNGVMHTYYELGENIGNGYSIGEHDVNNKRVTVLNKDQIGTSAQGSSVYKGAIQILNTTDYPTKSKPFIEGINIQRSRLSSSTFETKIRLKFSENMKISSLDRSSIIITNEDGSNVQIGQINCSSISCTLKIPEASASPKSWNTLTLKTSIQNQNGINLNREYTRDFEARVQ